MAKRILSMFLAVLTLVGTFALPTSAASTLDEAMAEVDIYARNDDLEWLTMNGSVKTQHYTYYNYTSAQTGQTKEIPAYCVDPRLYGVPALVEEGTSIKYSAESIVNDPKVCGIIANGYPHMPLSTLGVESVDEAYYATKTALWIYLLGNWSLDGLGINPSLSGAEKAAAERVLQATRDIYNRGMTWDKMVSPKLTATADQDTAYPVTINGEQYYQQVITINSETWPIETVKLNLANGAPDGAKILDMNNQEIDRLTVSTSGSNGYEAQCKIVYPASEVEGQTGTAQLNMNSVVVQYAIYYARCLETDQYGNVQDYMLDTDPNIPISASFISRFSAESDMPDESDEPDTPGTNLKIIKLEEGTDKPLEGAVFEVLYPNGDVVGSFATDSKGVIEIPVTITGNYTVTELTPPEDHLLPERTTQNVTVVHGKTAEVTFWNAPYGSLRVEKISDTGEPLEGVTIQIKHIESGETQTGTTSGAGVITFDGLEPGGYEVRELAGIKGWQADTDTIQTVSIMTGETSTVTFTNKELPGLRILKYDRTTLKVMSDVTFEIWRDGVSLGQFSTDQMGEILLLDAQPGTYLVKEVQSDDEHIVDTTPQQIELQAGDGIRDLVFFNDLKPGMRLVKVDSANPSKVIPNAVFEIKSVAGDYGPEEFRTDENGEIDLSKLPAGAYVVTELSCPGYVIDEAQRIIQLDPNEDAQFVFTNSIKPSLQLIKLSSDGSTLEGVTFRICKIEDGTHYLNRTTNKSGEILISDLEPGVYSVVETATVSDHIIDLREYKVELFPSKTSTLVIENQIRPNLYVYKHDADTGEPIADTVFTVRAADGHSVDEIRTDENGRAELKNLLPGVYEISEKSVPSPWLLDAPSQLVTLYPNRDHTVYFENHQKPNLTVNKICSVTGNPLEGAKFQVIYASNNTESGEINDLGYFYTDENGQFKISDLNDGWYEIIELESVPGYRIKDPASQTVFIKAGESKTVTFENTPLSALVVYKYDSVTGEAVGNAVFQVKYLTGTSGTGGTVIGTYKTSANGSFTVTGLDEGTYIVEELASDSNHVIDTAPQTIYISGKEQDVVELYFGNSPKGALLIKKIDSVSREPLSDVEFFVTTSDGTVVGNANGKFVTDSAGTVLIEGIDPGTTLVVKETRTKDNTYILDDTPQTAQIKAGQTVTLEFRNQPKGNLIINKLDSVTGEPLEGVEFKITYADGSYVDAEGGKISTKGTYVTDSNGQIILSDITGTLVVTEEKTISGYSINPETRSQTVVVNPDDTQILTFYNDPYGNLLIKKVDSVTKKPLSGVEFKITGCNGCEYPAGTYTTDENGLIHLKSVPSGCYEIFETKQVDGYLLDDTVHTVKVESGKCKEVTFENAPLGSLVIKKMDAVTKEPLAGAIFRVTTADGAAVGTTGGEFRTDENGYISISDIEPSSLVVTEVQAPEGYLLDDSPKTIEIKDHQTYVLEFFNQPLGNLIIHKLDSVTKEPLEGVQFKITYADGRVVDADNGQLSSNGLYWTDENGQIKIAGITGTVVASEVETIPGYTIHEETRSQTVVVNTNDTQSLYFYNDPVGGLELIKVNADKKTERIPGVTFEIRRMDDGLVDTVTTDKNGRVFCPLADGAYYAVEIEAGEGFELDNTPHYFEVKDGKTTTLTITNKVLSGILIHKIDSTTGDGIYGVTFLLYDSNKNPIGQYESDQDGWVYITDLTKSGRYYIRELENEGYNVDTQLKTVYVKAGKTVEIEWENEPITGQIQIYKYAAEYNAITGTAAGTPLQGAVYEIINARSGKVVDYITTDARGVAASKALPLTRYQIREVTAPAYWQVDATVHDVTLEYAGQIIKLSAYDKAANLGVSITKRGNAEALSGSQMRYDITVANTSNVPLESFYWHDRLPTDIANATVLSTGTYSARLAYRILYKTNYMANYQVLASNLLTSNDYSFALNAIPMQAGEVVTDIYFDFGTVPVGFQSVTNPTLSVMVKGTAVNGYQMLNRSDVGGMYQNTWQTAQANWITIIRKMWNTPTLPKTGY